MLTLQEVIYSTLPLVGKSISEIKDALKLDYKDRDVDMITDCDPTDDNLHKNLKELDRFDTMLRSIDETLSCNFHTTVFTVRPGMDLSIIEVEPELHNTHTHTYDIGKVLK